MIAQISQWIKDGCKPDEGLALYLRYGDNEDFKDLIKEDAKSCWWRIRFLLTSLAGIDTNAFSAQEKKEEGDRFRMMYPFLGDRNIPPEIKALATDKISTYWRIVELHSQLFVCHKNKDCLAVAGELVDTFVEDLEIKAELDHYRDFKEVLGKHRMFKQAAAVDKIRRMSLKELFIKERQLRDNIWRINNEIAKGDKPYLEQERKKRLQDKEAELVLVLKMMS